MKTSIKAIFTLALILSFVFPVAAQANNCGSVFEGSIERLRIYSSGSKVMVYLSPGNNQDYVGYSTDANMIKALFEARNNGMSVTGYSAEDCYIGWLDY